MDDVELCTLCDSIFDNKFSLERHMKCKHSSNSKSEQDGSVVFDCDICKATYKSKHGIQYHIINTHLQKPLNRRKNKIICGECNTTVLSRKILRVHCSEKHQLELKEETYSFQSDIEFRNWKLQVERKNYCRFVLTRGGQLLKIGTKRKYFFCHRDGYFGSKSKKLKLMKKQGSNKINASCPAEIIYSQSPDGSITVQYFSSHLGHLDSIGRLNLTSDERAAIAEKIREGIPLQTILDRIRSTIIDVHSPLGRLTKRDLRNIRRDFNLLKHNQTKYEQAISRGHQRSFDVTITKVREMMWTARNSFTKNAYVYYVVIQLEQDGKYCEAKEQCFSKCLECGICIHTYSCECTDYMKENNICKHIHACALSNAKPTIFNSNNAMSPLSFTVTNENFEVTCSDIGIDNLNSNTSRSSTPVILQNEHHETIYSNTCAILESIKLKIEAIKGYLIPETNLTSEEMDSLSEKADDMLDILAFKEHYIEDVCISSDHSYF